MRYRRLGTTSIEISTVGFGSWAAGGENYLFGLGSQRDEDTVEAIMTAVAAGVNWIDTAAVYGLGHSERVVGDVLRRLSAGERPLVMTKCGLVEVSDDRYAMPERNLRPESIRNECLRSLERLGIETIDVYFFHWPDQVGTPIEESWSAMQELISEGLVRYGGVSNFSVDEMDRCQAIAPISVIQPPLSLLRRASLRDVIPWAEHNGAGVVAYSALQSGLLTGRLTRERAGEMALDWRGQSPELHEPLVTHCLDLQPVLSEIANRYDTFGGVVAIAWALAQSGVSGAIVGGRSRSQVEEWLPAGTLELSADDIETLESATRLFVELEPPEPV